MAMAKAGMSQPDTPSAAAMNTPSESKNSAAFLANAAINLVSLREYYRVELVKILNTIKGKKALVLDRKLSGPLGLVAEVELLKKHGVDNVYHLLPDELRTNSTNVVYFVRPDVRLMTMIADQILAHNRAVAETNAPKRTYSVYFVPRRTMLCERVLKEAGVYGDVRTGEFALELIPFDEDVLSLEMSNTFSDCFLSGDPTTLFYIARSIMKLQSIFGIIPNVKGKGDMAHRVFNLIHRMRREAPKDMFNSLVPEIDSLILIDRSTDLVTPLLTQMTYEGLVDEMFGITNSFIEIDAELVGGKPATGKDTPTAAAGKPAADATPAKKKQALNSNDTLFKEIRDQNFRVLGPYLHRKAELVASTYEQRHNAKTVKQLSEFMPHFKTAHSEHAFLQAHINIAERISQVTKSNIFERHIDMEQQFVDAQETRLAEDYLEACIAKQEPLLKVLRLCCLLSLTKGIEKKKYDFFKREMIQTYGFEKMFTLNNLEKLGMFQPLTKKSNWPAIRKTLKLLEEKDKVDLKTPNDINYTYSGYAPLSVRIIELAARPGWKRMEEVLNLIPGKMFEFTQELPSSVQERAKVAALASGGGAAIDLKSTPGAAAAPAGAATPKVGPDGKPVTATTAGAAGTTAAAAGADKKSAPADLSSASSSSSPDTKKKPLTLVYFIGGVTFAEISALRFLGERDAHGRDYLIATTKLINGNTLLESVQETVWNRLKKDTINAGSGSAKAKK